MKDSLAWTAVRRLSSVIAIHVRTVALALTELTIILASVSRRSSTWNSMVAPPTSTIYQLLQFCYRTVNMTVRTVMWSWRLMKVHLILVLVLLSYTSTVRTKILILQNKIFCCLQYKTHQQLLLLLIVKSLTYTPHFDLVCPVAMRHWHDFVNHSSVVTGVFSDMQLYSIRCSQHPTRNY